jgi:hypothetical protein
MSDASKLAQSKDVKSESLIKRPPPLDHPIAARRAPLHKLQQALGNQATLRLLAQQARNLTGNEQDSDPASLTVRRTTPGVSWDFSKAPVFPAGRANGPQMRSSLSAPSLSGVLEARLAVGQVDHPLEHEADNVADQVIRMPDPDSSPMIAPLQLNRRGATCREVGQTQQMKTAKSSEAIAGEAPSIVHAVLRSPGRPLDQSARAFFEPRFGHDLSAVRVHSDARATESVQAIGALAYTVGTHIVTGPGADSRLVAHELAHVVQQASSPAPSSPVVRRQSVAERIGTWYEEKKWSAYHALINALRSAKNTALIAARSQVPSLPAWAQGSISTILDIGDFLIDLEIAACLAIIGLAVGFAEGLAGLITGIVKMAYRLLKLVADIILAVLGKGEAFKSDLDAIANAVRNFFPGVKARIGTWMDRYKKATAEDQVIMGAELVGEIEAFLATFAFAEAKAAQVGAKSTSAGEAAETVGAKSTTASEVAETVGTKSTTAGEIAEAKPTSILQEGKPGADVVPPKAVAKPKPTLRESQGASPRGGSFESASAKTSRSLRTAIRADVGESEAYKQMLAKGEIGLQRPQGANVGGADCITAARTSNGEMEVIVTDVKTSEVGRFPTPNLTLKPAWRTEVSDAIAPGRLNLGDPALEAEIRNAVSAGRVRVRQVNFDYSPAGQGRISGLAETVGTKSTAAGEIAGPPTEMGPVEILKPWSESQSIRAPFIGQALEFPVMNDIEQIGIEAAGTFIEDANAMRLYQAGGRDMTAAGRRFHDIAHETANAYRQAGRISDGWDISAEKIIPGGRKKPDILARGPRGKLVEVDWKTSTQSAMQKGTVKRMDLRRAEIGELLSPLDVQISRNWVDLVEDALRRAGKPNIYR